jgi:predicted phosphodiesterase
MATSSVVVLSDAHLGEPHSLLELIAFQEAVVRAVAERAGRTLVLLGDTLDLDFGTLVTGIEGRYRHPDRAGLRGLLQALCQRTGISRILYVPGNHDFAVWDWEAMWRHTLRPLHDGGKITGGVLREGCLYDTFLTGLLPGGPAPELTVSFPHCVVTVGGADILCTHGHYLDPRQCGGVSLLELNRLPESERARFLDKLFKASAQYQTVLEAMAIRRSWRAQAHRLYSAATAPLDWLNAWWNSLRGLRGKPLSSKQVPMIEAYLRYVARGTTASAFIFGHTHVPGRRETPIPIYNSGSFVPPRGYQASMLFLYPAQEGAEAEIAWFDASGVVRGEPYGTIRPLAQPSSGVAASRQGD